MEIDRGAVTKFEYRDLFAILFSWVSSKKVKLVGQTRHYSNRPRATKPNQSDLRQELLGSYDELATAIRQLRGEGPSENR